MFAGQLLNKKQSTFSSAFTERYKMIHVTSPYLVRIAAGNV